MPIRSVGGREQIWSGAVQFLDNSLQSAPGPRGPVVALRTRPALEASPTRAIEPRVEHASLPVISRHFNSPTFL